MKRGRQLGAAFGLDVAELALPVSGAASAGSFHLEVHLPPELASARLELPPLLGTSEPACTDDSGNPVAHVYARYGEVPEEQDAVVHIAVPWAGLRMATCLVTTFTALVFLLERLLPGASDALRTSSEGAAALLLVAPALLIAFGTRSRESATVSHLLAPLRGVTVCCALLLVAAAASIVGGLKQPWYDILWWAGAISSGGVALILARAPRSMSDLRARLLRKIWN